MNKKDRLSKIMDKLPTIVTLDSCHDLKFPRSKAAMDKYEKENGYRLEPRFTHPAVISYCIKGIGFGQVILYRKGNKLFCDNEDMDKDTIKAILCALIDNAIFTHPTTRD